MKKKFYNQEVKERFLASRTEATHGSYSRLFDNALPVERDMGKDLYELDITEIEQILNEMQVPTLASVRALVYLVRSYIDWAVAEGLTETNALDNTDSKWAEQFIRKDTKLFITEEELTAIENSCANAQDAVIFRLLFEGVGGAQLSEITNLTKDGVDYRRKELRLINNKKIVRFLKVSDRCLDLIKSAIEQEYYWTTSATGHYITLVNSNYVVRPADSSAASKKRFTNAQWWVITKRVRDIVNNFGLVDITPKNVQRSGMLYQVKLLMDAGVEPTIDNLKRIVNRYNMNVQNHNIYYDFLNTDTVNQLYGE